MTKDETLKLALEALENSVDLVREDAYEAEKLYGNYPTRQGKVNGLKVLADDHEKAITALREALASEAIEQPAQQEQEPTATELSNGLGLALHDAVLIRIGGSDEATKQACARIDKLVEKYRAEHPDTQPAQQQEPVAWLKVTEHWLSGMPKLEIAKPQEQGAKPVYLNPYQLT